MNSTPVLTARGLCKSFGEIVVAHDVNLTLTKGVCLGVIGPNGAGKSSLFGLLDGALSPDRGEIFLGDVDITHMPRHKRARLGLARAHQIPQPFTDLSVYENVLVAATFAAGLHGRAAQTLALQVIDRAGLGSKARVTAGSLTLLDRKRLELAKALAAQPKVMMLDEIAGGLTEPEGRKLVELINSIKPDVAMIWIEHVAHALTAVADSLMVLHFGRKIAEGPVRETLDGAEVRRIYMGIDIDAAA